MIFILLRLLNIHYRDNIAMLAYISNITKLSKVLREAIVLKVLLNYHFSVFLNHCLPSAF